MYLNRFLRGKIVDKAMYDLWKDQSQNKNENEGNEMSNQIQTMSFSIDDDDDQTEIISYRKEAEKKDSVLLLVNTQ